MKKYKYFCECDNYFYTTFVFVVDCFTKIMTLKKILKNDKKNTDLNSDNNPFDFVLYLYLPSNSYFLNAKFFLRKA